MAHSNVKGSSFEREVANYLSERFKEFLGVEKGFQRSLSSGAYFGGKNAHRMGKVMEDQLKTGDINYPMNFRFSIECKRYKTAPHFSSLQKSFKEWDKWIEQNSICADNKAPILIVKYDKCKPVVVVKESDLEDYGFKEHHLYGAYLKYFSSNGYVYLVYLMETFFAFNDSIYFE